MRTDTDPTRISLQTNVKKEVDPTIQRMTGVTNHGNIPFDVSFISHIEGNLWQGGIDQRLHLELPKFFKHVVSLYPWESYRIRHDIDSLLVVKMYDSLDQSIEQVRTIAEWVNVCKKSGPVLVHCQAGLNRSSLVAAISLILDGKTPDEAINLLREKRSPAVLCNPAFEQYVRGYGQVN